MIEWKLGAFNILVRPIEEVVDGESIRFVHVLWATDRSEHWTNNNIRIDDCQVERWLVVGNELPCRFFRELFGGIVAQDGAFRLNRGCSGNLQVNSVSLYGRPSSSRDNAYWIPVFFGIVGARGSPIIERIQNGDGASQEHKALDLGSTKLMSAVQEVNGAFGLLA